MVVQKLVYFVHGTGLMGGTATGAGLRQLCCESVYKRLSLTGSSVFVFLIIFTTERVSSATRATVHATFCGSSASDTTVTFSQFTFLK